MAKKTRWSTNESLIPHPTDGILAAPVDAAVKKEYLQKCQQNGTKARSPSDSVAGISVAEP